MIVSGYTKAQEGWQATPGCHCSLPRKSPALNLLWRPQIVILTLWFVEISLARHKVLITVVSAAISKLYRTQ